MAAVPAQAQEAQVTAVRYEVQGERVLIHYNLVGPAKSRYDVRFAYRVDRTGLPIPIEHVEGDVGEVVPGMGRVAVWLPLKQFPSGLESDRAVVQVIADVYAKKSRSWLYLVGGAVVAGLGGTVALTMGGGGDTGAGDPGGGDTGGGGAAPLPTPPGRPTGN